MDSWTPSPRRSGKVDRRRSVTDADHYVQTFSALQDRTDVRFRAIADLIDSTEDFWKDRAPDSLSAPRGERIFLIDWRLFFEREHELSRYSRRGNAIEANPDYAIYVATNSDLDRDDRTRSERTPSARTFCSSTRVAPSVGTAAAPARTHAPSTWRRIRTAMPGRRRTTRR